MTAEQGLNAPRRPRPLLMVPLRRCGSHALRLRLNLNPDFYAPYPLHIVDFMPLVPLYGDLADDRVYFQLITDVIGLETASMVKWPDVVFDPGEIFEALQSRPRSVHSIVWELLFRAGEQRGAKVVMDKSLDSIHYADELMALFPDMLFLNVLRDPRAQVASMNRAVIHDFDTALNAMTWVRAYDAGQALAQQYPDRVLTIRYEDFLADQEATLKKICGFVGIEFLPQMLDVSFSQEAQRISKMSDLWEANAFPPIAANVDKFKSQLSVEDIELIETLTQDHMRKYGYEFLTGAKAAVPDAAELAARIDRSTHGREDAWRLLTQKNHRDYVLRRFRADYIGSVRTRLSTPIAG